MNTTATTAAATRSAATATSESVPTTWIDERDVPFFRITASLFDPEFLLGATVLLASYDADAIVAAMGRTLSHVCSPNA